MGWFGIYGVRKINYFLYKSNGGWYKCHGLMIN